MVSKTRFTDKSQPKHQRKKWVIATPTWGLMCGGEIAKVIAISALVSVVSHIEKI